MMQVNKTERFQVRVNRAELVALNLVAQREALNVSEAMRLAIREAAALRNLWPPPPMPATCTGQEVRT